MRPWKTWLIFGLCAVVLLGVIAWVSRMALRLDRAQAEAATQAELEENVRLALWRMDSMLAPLIAQESVRPYFVYSPFRAADRAYDNDVEALLQMRRLIDFLPASNRDDVPEWPTFDATDRIDASLDTLVPEDLPRLEAALAAAGWPASTMDDVVRVAAPAGRAADLNREAAAAGITLSRLIVAQDNLEEIFLDMTGRVDGELADGRAAATERVA
jgi:hypothetical protein